MSKKKGPTSETAVRQILGLLKYVEGAEEFDTLADKMTEAQITYAERKLEAWSVGDIVKFHTYNNTPALGIVTELNYEKVRLKAAVLKETGETAEMICYIIDPGAAEKIDDEKVRSFVASFESGGDNGEEVSETT